MFAWSLANDLILISLDFIPCRHPFSESKSAIKNTSGTLWHEAEENAVDTDKTFLASLTEAMHLSKMQISKRGWINL